MSGEVSGGQQQAAAEKASELARMWICGSCGPAGIEAEEAIAAALAEAARPGQELRARVGGLVAALDDPLHLAAEAERVADLYVGANREDLTQGVYAALVNLAEVFDSSLRAALEDPL